MGILIVLQGWQGKFRIYILDILSFLTNKLFPMKRILQCRMIYDGVIWNFLDLLTYFNLYFSVLFMMMIQQRFTTWFKVNRKLWLFLSYNYWQVCLFWKDLGAEIGSLPYLLGAYIWEEIRVSKLRAIFGIYGILQTFHYFSQILDPRNIRYISFGL